MWKETESCPDIKFKSCSVIKTRVKGLSCRFIWNNQKNRENRWPNESHLFHFICKRLVFLEMTKSLLYESPKNWCKQGKMLKDLQTLNTWSCPLGFSFMVGQLNNILSYSLPFVSSLSPWTRKATLKICALLLFLNCYFYWFTSDWTS